MGIEDLTCCLPEILLITAAVDALLKPSVVANCANSVAILELVIEAG